MVTTDFLTVPSMTASPPKTTTLSRDSSGPTWASCPKRMRVSPVETWMFSTAPAISGSVKAESRARANPRRSVSGLRVVLLIILLLIILLPPLLGVPRTVVPLTEVTIDLPADRDEGRPARGGYGPLRAVGLATSQAVRR